MNYPDDLKYHAEHMWFRPRDGRIGITDFAQDQLGPLIFAALPAVGARIARGESLGQIEAEKTISDLIAPVTGTVAEISSAFFDDAEITNRDPYEAGWLLRVEIDDPAELDELMAAADYAAQVSEAT